MLFDAFHLRECVEEISLVNDKQSLTTTIMQVVQLVQAELKNLLGEDRVKIISCTLVQLVQEVHPEHPIPNRPPN